MNVLIIEIKECHLVSYITIVLISRVTEFTYDIAGLYNYWMLLAD